MADLTTAREYIDYQFSLDDKMDGAYFTQQERRWYIEQLIQLEQAEALEKLASLFDTFRRVGLPVENVH
jgi:hypothetical protein